MEKELAQQYDEFNEKFIDGTAVYNEPSRKAFYSALEFDIKNKKVLDIGCGEGYDLSEYKKRGALVYGLDASKELLAKAKLKIPKANLTLGFMEQLPYEDSTFDIIVSKYTLQTSLKLTQVLKEISRVLKQNGILIYLVVHPLRQFLEKKKHPKNYFAQEIVESIFFNGAVTAKEPTHTIEEYLNPEFLKEFRIINFEEHPDFPSSERIDGDHYPCFFVLKAQKL